MQRIDTQVAMQVGDITRPQHSHVDRRLQKEVVDAEELKEAPEKEINSEDVRTAAAELKQVLEVASGKRLDFGIHENTEGLFVKIMEQGTDTVIKQIPSEDIVELRQRIDEIIGVILDEEA